MKMKVSRNEDASDFGTHLYRPTFTCHCYGKILEFLTQRINSKDQLCSCKSCLAELGEAVGADEVLRMELLEERSHAATLDRRVARRAHVLALCLWIEQTTVLGLEIWYC